MKKTPKNYFFLFISVFFIFTFAAAASAEIVPCGNSNDPYNACTLCHLIIGIDNIVEFGLELLITAAAVAIFIAGLMYIMSSGDEEMTKRAKSFLGAALKGFTIVLMAWFFINITLWLISKNGVLNLESKNWHTFTCSTKSSVAP